MHRKHRKMNTVLTIGWLIAVVLIAVVLSNREDV
jgi:hypothetical protein